MRLIHWKEKKENPGKPPSFSDMDFRPWIVETVHSNSTKIAKLEGRVDLTIALLLVILGAMIGIKVFG